MADRCIFCGEMLGLLQKKKLSCGNIAQTVCAECYRKYEPLSVVERAEAALQTGRAEQAGELHTYLEKIRSIKDAKKEKERADDEKRATDKECLRCGGRMLDYGPITLKLGEETYFMSDYNRLVSGSMDVNVLRCETCGKTEFYIYDATKLVEMTKRKKDMEEE